MRLMTMTGAILCAFLSSGLPAQTSTAGPASPKTFQLSKVILDTETSPLSARIKGGTWCVFPSNIQIPKRKTTQNYEKYDNLFSRVMKQRGFTVLNSSADMFAEAKTSKSDYLVGVTLRPSTLNLCDSIKGQKGDVALIAEWQIYDQAAGKIVETISTTGQAKRDVFATDGQIQLINEAFTSSLDALIGQGVLQKYTAVAPTNTAASN